MREDIGVVEITDTDGSRWAYSLAEFLDRREEITGLIHRLYQKQLPPGKRWACVVSYHDGSAILSAHGPYSSQDQAEQASQRLRDLGVHEHECWQVIPIHLIALGDQPGHGPGDAQDQIAAENLALAKYFEVERRADGQVTALRPVSGTRLEYDGERYIVADLIQRAVLTVITGPPCSGKSSYARQHALPGDIIIDFDLIAQALGSPVSHDHDYHLREVAAAAWASAINRAIEFHLAGKRAWIVDSTPTGPRQQLYTRAGARIVTLTAARDELHRRADAAGRPLSWHNRIDQYPDGPSSQDPAPQPRTAW